MPSRHYHAMAFDAAHGKVMVFGGLTEPTSDGASRHLGDLWER